MTNTDYIQSIHKASSYIQAHAPRFKPEIGIILGSGLSQAVPPLTQRVVISYDKIPGFPRTTVAGHAGQLILGRCAGKDIAVMSGRFHFYEGHSMAAITLPVRALKELGLKALLVTAAVGSLRPKIKPGQFVIVTDHINFMGYNPLRGVHTKEFGVMFPDLKDAYDPSLNARALTVCRKQKIPAAQGIYVAVAGPAYETAAEIRAFAALGADVVGMSVVPEIIVARQLGVRAMALTWVSNMANGLSKTALAHADVLALGQRVGVRLRGVLEGMLDL